MKQFNVEVMKLVTFTSKNVISVEIPVARFTQITDTTYDPLFALTETTLDDLSTPTKGITRDLLSTSRITVTFCNCTRFKSLLETS